MREGMGSGAVKRHFGADADADDHEPKLVVQAVGENAAQIVFDFREEDREQSHDGTDVDQDLGACETTREGVDC